METAADHGRPGIVRRIVGNVPRSLLAVLLGTFTLRFSTGLTGGLLVNYLKDLPVHGGPVVEPYVVGIYAALFYSAELVMSTPFGLISDRYGHHRVMQLGPLFGLVAVVVTFLTTDLFLLGGTRVLEGLSTAASVPSILGFLAVITAGDELLRGRAAARFEGATLAGLGAGIVAAGLIWHVIGPFGFLVNTAIYALSFAIYRFGVPAEPGEAESRQASHPGMRRYATILKTSHVWLLAPTWIAINAALGLWTTNAIFQLLRPLTPDPKFSDQLLMGKFDSVAISLGLAAGLVVFFLGLAFWGERFRRYRRTTIILFGVLGGAAVVVAAALVNHSEGLPDIVRVAESAVVVGGLFVLAGATPAALGMLADVSESFPSDRGAIMGLYSVFLALGQIGGSLLGGFAAEVRGIDGILVATLLLLVVALVPLRRLRAVEHLIGGPVEGMVALG
ncbi:MAG: MFS transporter [Candidatus Limnocylindrales bacterium]